MTKLDSAIQALLLQARKEAGERFLKLHKKWKQFIMQKKFEVRLLPSLSL